MKGPSAIPQRACARAAQAVLQIAPPRYAEPTDVVEAVAPVAAETPVMASSAAPPIAPARNAAQTGWAEVVAPVGAALVATASAVCPVALAKTAAPTDAVDPAGPAPMDGSADTASASRAFERAPSTTV